jgi:hypothetical protein
MGSANSAFGSYAMRANTTGGENAAFGQTALRSNTTGVRNAAFGRGAMYSNTIGNENAAFGVNALAGNTFSYNAAFGTRALQNNTSSENAAVGFEALRLNTTGMRNAAMGNRALVSNSTGSYSTAVGWHALYLGNGTRNTAVGNQAMELNQTGFNNQAFGDLALHGNTGGLFNTAIGSSALAGVTTGSRNVGLGTNAGSSQTTGSDNIYIVNQGVAAESGQIKIGTVGTHSGVTIAGISGATSTSGIAVLVNASGKLGTTTSSARFKQNVRDMDHASDVLMKLRPVAFEYREDVVGAEDAKTTQYGLIAEEVAQVAPELVAPDLDGKPYSVKYHELPALLLSQVQQQQRTIESQRAQIAELTTRLAEVERRVAPAR